MTLRAITEETTAVTDVYYVAFENDQVIMFINDDAAYALQQQQKNTFVSDMAYVAAADIVIDKTTKLLIKSRNF